MLQIWKTIRLEQLGKHIVTVCLNRPKSLNAFNTEMAKEIQDAFQMINEDNNVRSVILCGEGKHFCVGADLKERNNLSFPEWEQQHQMFRDATQAILNTNVPVIVASHGYCVGAGLELSLCADLFVGSLDGQYGLPETKLGIFPGIGGTPLIARQGGTALAKRMILTGDLLSTDELHRCGVIQWKSDDVMKTAIEIAETISKRNPYAIQKAKRALNQDRNMSFDNSMKYSLDLYMDCAQRDDRGEGVAAFVERREPYWVP